jgi:hypothetical protein
MFVQVIDGRTSQPDAVREVFERWVGELSSGATGWLGSTAGFTADGRVIASARFESEEDARRNSDRPEQGKWWSDLVSALEGEPRVTDSTDVTVTMIGNPDDAGFVQVVRGPSTDPARMRDLMSPPQDFSSFRPDVLGDVAVVSGQELIDFIYFTSEDDARRNEKKELPQEFQALMDEAMKLVAGEPEWFDLSQPILISPSSA